jgi:5'-nucleotidase/UDP-sugar diphosphatase
VPFPFPCRSDDECTAIDPGQRCFVIDTWEIGRCMYAVVDDYQLIDAYGAYELAANDYIARGGSGFRVLGRNTTQEDLEIPLREAVVEHVRAGPPCTENAPCETSADCRYGELCACDAVSAYGDGGCWWTDRGEIDPEGAPSCGQGGGHCILAACATDVATFRAERISTCDRAEDEATRGRCWCDAGQWAMEECQTLACIDLRVGAYEEGRIGMVQP